MKRAMIIHSADGKPVSLEMIGKLPEIPGEAERIVASRLQEGDTWFFVPDRVEVAHNAYNHESGGIDENCVIPRAPYI